jgi:hypothetical protein
MEISAIWLCKEGDSVIVLFERDGIWYNAIREHADGSFSHITELNVTGPGPDAGRPRPKSDFGWSGIDPEDVVKTGYEQ